MGSIRSSRVLCCIPSAPSSSSLSNVRGSYGSSLLGVSTTTVVMDLAVPFYITRLVAAGKTAYAWTYRVEKNHQALP